MKLVPNPLPPLPTGSAMDRLPLPIPFGPEFLWRYPFGFPAAASAAVAAVANPQFQQPPVSPLMDFKTHLPASLTGDPRLWSREDVVAFLKWFEGEFDVKPFDLEMFQMNGKALCLLTRNDFSERCPAAGDVLHNVLQLLICDHNLLQRCLPSSPVTPTSRHSYPLTPHSQPGTPNWYMVKSEFDPALAAHFMAQSNSVTLSPAPSVDSQAGSPQHTENGTAGSVFGNGGLSNGSGSNQSDSDEDSYQDNQQNSSPPNTPTYNSIPPTQLHQNLPPPAQQGRNAEVKPPSNNFKAIIPREFFPESPEPNTNGRLLWDFLQQLLNDPTQRYTNYIAWKERETGVFKIVDPAGLAKLWGIQKNHLSMNYDKMSRALRYYYRVNILRKVQGERHCYQFLRNPTELKNIKNISLLRQQMSPLRPNPCTMDFQQQSGVKSETLKQEHNNMEQDYDDVPAELKNIKNISVFRQQVSPLRPNPSSIEFQQPAVSNPESFKQEQNNMDQDYEEMPTDLSMPSAALHMATDLSNNSRATVTKPEADSNQFHHTAVPADLDEK